MALEGISLGISPGHTAFLGHSSFWTSWPSAMGSLLTISSSCSGKR
jgi:hypothetical protein